MDVMLMLTLESWQWTLEENNNTYLDNLVVVHGRQVHGYR